MALDVVGVLGGLIFVNDTLHHFDFFLTGEALQRDAVAWHELGEKMGELFLPRREVATDCDDGRGKDEGVAVVPRVIGSGVSMEGDEGAHALAAPDDFCFRMFLPDQPSEAVEISEPLAAMTDVTLAGNDGVVSLSTGLGGIDGGAGEIGEEMLGKGSIIGGCSGDSMDGDHDELRLAFRCPLGEGEHVTIEAVQGFFFESNGVRHGER